ncbi:hypothetical protein [Streptomyces sp. NP10]|uniref:hypothetical protein n=1 Tax=Streptomyces sp. NP10 TaxID=1141731 RepID=UPI001F54388F|nr:hypothetical protein [Streptomyces sp. NP10]
MRPRGVRPGKSEDASYGALGEGDVVRGASGDRDGHRLQGGDHRRGGVAARWARRDQAPAAAADQAFAGGEQRGDGLVDRLAHRVVPPGEFDPQTAQHRGHVPPAVDGVRAGEREKHLGGVTGIAGAIRARGGRVPGRPSQQVCRTQPTTAGATSSLPANWW